MNPKPKIYLDIDGVLLTTKKTQKAENSDLFVDFLISNFDCYWLTTHCKGDAKTAVNYLSRYFEDKTIKLLKQVKPTNWHTLKTEAIDFESDFFWLEDNPMHAEISILKNKAKLHSLVVVNLHEKDELVRIVKFLGLKNL